MHKKDLKCAPDLELANLKFPQKCHRRVKQPKLGLGMMFGLTTLLSRKILVGLGSVFFSKSCYTNVFLLFYQLAFLWHFWNSCKWYVSSIKSMSSSTTICLFKKVSWDNHFTHMNASKNEDFLYSLYIQCSLSGFSRVSGRFSKDF